MRTSLRLSLMASTLALWNAAPAQAASQGCLLDNPKKVCASVTASPLTAQPSQQNGTKTYVRYDATIVNVTAQSTRYVVMDMALSPATSFATVTADPKAVCTKSGATIHCDIDKLDAGEPLTVSAVAETPTYETTLTNTVTYGWQGRTSTVAAEVPIRHTSGESWQQPNQAIRLSTHKPTADPSQQTTPEDPLYGEVIIPGNPGGGQVFIKIITDGPDRSSVCPAGIYLDPLGDLGPYLCRDVNQPRRWIQVGAPNSDPPMQIKLIEDASIVQPIQLPPTLLTPLGTPPFAIFAHGEEEGEPFRAIAVDCTAANAQPPCVQNVQRYSTGDWTGTLVTPKVNLGPAAPLLPLGGDIGILGILPPIGDYM
jgi:hypothetical protein